MPSRPIELPHPIKVRGKLCSVEPLARKIQGLLPPVADLGVQPHVIEAILNHVSGHKAGVAGILQSLALAST